MSKVAEFINCVIDGDEYKGKEKWEIIDGVIIGFFSFMFGMMVVVMI